jgi:hypothetical protein
VKVEKVVDFDVECAVWGAFCRGNEVSHPILPVCRDDASAILIVEAITGICRKASLGDSHGSSGARTQLSIGLGSGSSMRPRKKASRLCSSVG